MTIGEMREMVTLERYTPGADDGYGGTLPGVWSGYTAWARIQNLKGSETVIAARLGGKQPVMIAVRWTPDLAAMTTAWRARHSDTLREYDIKSVAADEAREFVEILAEYET